MIDVEPVLHDELERLAPEDELALPDWQDVIRRAHRPSIAPAPRSRIMLRSAAAILAVAGTIAAVALVLPWSSGPSVVERALAAVGDRPVLHAVIEQPPWPGGQLIEIESGEVIERVETTAIWFDRSRDLKKTVTFLDGEVLDETLETPEGGFTRGGRIYTCAWIAAHPVEATKARVSCNSDMENGTTPRQIPEQPPTLDAALAGFADGYRSALASGRVREVARGDLDGDAVIWLELPPVTTGPVILPPDRVAIDADTYKPIVVEAADGAVRFRVLEIETLPFDPSFFSMPKRVDSRPGGAGGSVGGDASEITPAQASAALGKPALWLGTEWRGYRLLETKRVELSIGYGSLSEREPTRTTGVELTYGRVAADATVVPRSGFTLRETTICVTRWGWQCGPRAPKPGMLLVNGPFPQLIRTDGVYVAVWRSDRLSEPTALELAQALRPVPNN